MSECTHDDIVSWRFEDGQPVGMWSCQDCKFKFVPITELIKVEDELAAAKAWKDAVIDAAVVGWTYCAADDDDPRGCLSRIMAMNQQIALDPAVSSEAAALIERGRQEVRADVEALRKLLKHAVNYGTGRDWFSAVSNYFAKHSAALAKEQP
jgi:hypothetical protein